MTDPQSTGVSFRRVGPSGSRPEDPEALFEGLKKAPGVQYLWSHQADVLRRYNEDCLSQRDIALELPTGAGKTLIGLLIAEYRRQKFDERALYLCPTRQLARQVGEQAKTCGIPSRVLLRPEYEGLDEFRLGSAVGITTYKALFNTNPRMSNPQTLILDDAHAAEDHVASLWSVRVSRYENLDLYRRLLRTVAPEMNEAFVEMMLDEDTSPDVRTKVDLLPQPGFVELIGEVRGLLDSELDERSEQRFSWSMIRENLHACFLYVSWSELLLRPIVPPTLTHHPFELANQRVYMSATLGEGGELERIIGVKRIRRIQAPKGWERRNSGRRLFLFPDRTMNREEAQEAVVNAAMQSGRTLVLAPTLAEASVAEQRLSPSMTVFKSRDIEESLDPFTSVPNSALVLANRYDGIDLPGDACRLLVVEGLPAGTNLQERFMLNRLGADPVLRDRLRTRFTQGTGRCCRSDSDYAVVIAIGQRLFDFCATRENRAGMHPELQAELQYGLEMSQDLTPESLSDYVRLFLDQGEDAKAVDQYIRDLRESMHKSQDAATEALMNVAPKEVAFAYALWRKDYPAALERAKEVADALEGGRETAPYRAWWHYLAGCAAWLAGYEQSDENLLENARDSFGRAARASWSVSWLAEQSRRLGSGSSPLEADDREIAVCESVYEVLVGLGLHGGKFDRKMSEFLGLVRKDESRPFEQGVELFGRLLGFDSSRPSDENAAPDGVWLLPDGSAITLEAKSEESSEHGISHKTILQAKAHETWVRNFRKVPASAQVITVVVSPRRSVDEIATLNAGEDLFYVNIDEFRQMAERLEAALRRARSRIVAHSDRQAAVEAIHEELNRKGLLPDALLDAIQKTPIHDLSVSG
jgi:hypothetical protein